MLSRFFKLPLLTFAEGTIEIPDPVTPVVNPIINAGEELTQPVIDHTEKITRIEERQAQHEVELLRQLTELEGRLQTATASQAQAIEERMARIEAKLEETAAAPIEAIPEAVDFDVPPIEESPAPPEKVKRGVRARRKAKRSNK
jgi:hypothetical protein